MVDPIIYDPTTKRATAVELQPIVDAVDNAVEPAWLDEPVVYRRGTIRPGGVADLCKHGLGPAGAQQVVPALAANPNIHHLLLGTNALGVDGMEAIAGALTSPHEIETVYLGCNGIDAAALEPLATALEADNTVQGLWLKRNPLDESGVAHVAKVLRRNRSIRTLDLVSTGLTATGLGQLEDALSSNPGTSLERLYLGGNDFAAADIAPIQSLLAQVPRLVQISLSGNPLGDDGAQRVADMVDELGLNVELGISNCSLTAHSAPALGRLVQRVSALTLDPQPIWLGRKGTAGDQNQVGDTGALAVVAEMAKQVLPLRILKLSGNGLTSRGAQAIANALDAHEHQIAVLSVGRGTAGSLRRRIQESLHSDKPPTPLSVSAIRSSYR